ncbi:MAG: hypothetical protein QOF58_3932 [Pseudonocardiales bacterium]|nr:hypothetical protein [Pseudonocardiales bacterium]
MNIKIRAAAITVATSLVAVPLALSGTAFAQEDTQPTGYIGGYVFNDLNGDGKKQDNEPGIRDVDVMIKEPNGQTHGFPTSADGVYTIKRAPYGEYEVSYVDPKLGNTTPSSVKVNLNSGGVDLSFGVRGGSICGTAWSDTNEDGKRQAGEAPLAGRSIGLQGSTRPVVTTGADGSYCIDGLDAGDYQLVATRKNQDAVVLTKNGGDSRFDWVSGEVSVKVGKGEQVKGIDAGFMPARGDLKAVQLLINRDGQVTSENNFRVGDVIDVYGSVMANGNMPEFLGGTLTLPQGLHILQPLGGLGEGAGVVGQEVHVAFSNKKPIGLVEFLGARVKVEKEFTGGEIKWEVQGLYADTDPGNNVLTRKIDALPAQPEQNHGPAVVDAQVKKTSGLANTGADPVATGAIGLGALVLGGLALFGARRRRRA